MQSSGELRNRFNVRKDTERLEEFSANEDLLLCCNCSCESSIQTEVGLTTEQAFYDLDFF